ncbi:MAG: hypothetical protein AAFN30_10475 [Actinomycetota bacterium]
MSLRSLRTKERQDGRRPRSATLAATTALLLGLSACGFGDGADPTAGAVGHQPIAAADGTALAGPISSPPNTVPIALAPPVSGVVPTTSTTAAANTTTPTIATPTTAPTTTATPAPADTAPADTAPSTAAPAPTDPGSTTTAAPSSSTTTAAPAPTTTVAPTTSAPPSTASAQIVEFRIPAGTGSGPWNSFGNPVRVRVGQILRIHNDDSVAHTMHAGGSPFKHGPRINPGSFKDHRVLSPYQPVNGSPKLYDHNRGKGAAFWVVAES